MIDIHHLILTDKEEIMLKFIYLLCKINAFLLRAYGMLTYLY